MNMISKTLHATAHIAIISGAIFSSAAFAHAALQSASPAVNAAVNAAPDKLVLNFSEPVMLMSIKLNNSSAQKSIAVNYQPSSKLDKTHEIKLPAISPGQYEVQWQIMGNDSHNMNGKYSFSLK